MVIGLGGDKNMWLEPVGELGHAFLGISQVGAEVDLK